MSSVNDVTSIGLETPRKTTTPTLTDPPKGLLVSTTTTDTFGIAHTGHDKKRNTEKVHGQTSLDCTSRLRYQTLRPEHQQSH